MRLKIELTATENIRLPIHYNHLVQAMIYQSMDREFAEFLHEHGYEVNKRKFKLFTFSRLLGQYKILGSEILFSPPINLIIASPLKEFSQYLLNGLLTLGVIRLGKSELYIKKAVMEAPEAKSKITIKLLSPVVAYSTLLKPEGGKYTCYFQPGEQEFVRLAEENLRRKYQAVYKCEPPTGEIQIWCLRPPRLNLIKYKNFTIKGYSGILKMQGPQPLLQMAIDAGLGSKNSMGFGCGELINKPEKNKKNMQPGYKK